MTDWDPSQRRTVYTSKGHDTLSTFLDYLRGAILRKVDGVSDEDARRPMVASGTSLAGILKHLAFVERYWFQHVFAGTEVELPWSDEDPDADFRVEAWETVAGLSEFYRAEIELSNEITDGVPLKQKAANAHVPLSLRWILVHMVEETARHAGHADILREMIDGQTGE